MFKRDKFQDLFADLFMIFAFVLGMFVIICKIILIGLI